MANQRTYSITINGLTESVKAVDALNDSLKNLEERIKSLEGKTVNVGAKSSGGGSKSSSTSALSEEEKLEKQIAQLEEKRIAHSKQIYQNYLAAKDVLAETEKDQKQIAASERLAAKNYSNTIQGMKQELADIKQVMQTVDLGDGDQLKKMTERANELNSKLKEIEQSYGQFGRNVGNYASAADGFKELEIKVGNTVEKFNSARQALKALQNELRTLQVKKDQGIILSDEELERFQELPDIVAQLASSIADAGKPMDALMDTMQSFTAMAQVGQGISAFFGLDNTEIERSIQRLVALQNAMQGLQTIQKQLQTTEGLGNLLAKGGDKIDKMVAGITGAKVAAEGLTMGSKAATLAVRGLSMALKGVGIGLVIEAINLLVQGIEWTVGKLKDWVKGDADLVKAEKLLDDELERVNSKLDERNNELAKAYYTGVISQEEYFRKQLEETTNVINQQIEALKEKAALEGGRFNDNLQNNTNIDLSFGARMSDTQAKDLDELTQKWKLYKDAVLEGKDAMSKLSDDEGGFGNWLRSLAYTLDDTKDDLVEIGQVAISRFLKDYEHAMQTMQTDTKEGERELAELKKQMNDNEMLRSIFLNLDQYIPVEGIRKRVQQIISLIQGVSTSMNELETRTVQQVLRSEQLKIDAMKDGAEKRQAQRDLDKKKELADATLTAEDKANIEKKYQNRKLKEEKEANKKSLNETKKNNREILEAEKDLGNLRIANMKEGLNKVLKQLEEERKQRLAKVEADGRLVGERQAEINKLYDRKVIDAKKEWAEKVKQTYKNMWDAIYGYSLETTQKIASLGEGAIEAGRRNLEFGRSTSDSPYRISPENSSYGIQGTNQLSKSTAEELNIEKQNNKEIAKTYEERLEIIKKYWDERIDFELNAISASSESQKILENESFRQELREAENHYYELHDQLEKNYESGLILHEEYIKEDDRLTKDWAARNNVINEQHSQNLIRINQEQAEKIQNVTAEYFRERLQELRDFQTAVANLESKQPVFNSWGIINLAETKKNNENILASYRKLSSEIVNIKEQLQTQLDHNTITFDEFQQANRELDSFADSVGQKMDKVKYELSVGAQIGSFIQSIEQYVQAGLQAVQTVMNALADYQDYQFEKEQEMLDRENEMLEEKLDKQQEIIEEHKNNVESIEDELANSRGDRRQHLIDQLNAEMEAQRAAQKEEERIQKLKDANEKKQEQLEKKRKEAEYKRNLLSILVSTAMATANGLATQPFVPVGIAMGALATSLGMVQYALAAKAKPYRVGGQLEGGLVRGKRHSQGGVPVGNTGIEVEGDEMIIRRESTMPNIDVLNFINKSQRRLNIDDFIDFYSSGKVKKNIMNMSPKAKYSDGGYLSLPSMNYDFNINDRLIDSFERYASKPSVVQVVDIINKTDDINRVKVLAGL